MIESVGGSSGDPSSQPPSRVDPLKAEGIWLCSVCSEARDSEVDVSVVKSVRRVGCKPSGPRSNPTWDRLARCIDFGDRIGSVEWN